MFRSIKTKLNVAADLNISDLSAFKSVYLTIEFNFLSAAAEEARGTYSGVDHSPSTESIEILKSVRTID